MPAIATDLAAQRAYNLKHPPAIAKKTAASKKRRVTLELTKNYIGVTRASLTDTYLPIVYLRFCGYSLQLIARSIGVSSGLVSKVLRDYAPDLYRDIPTLHAIDRTHSGCLDPGAFWKFSRLNRS